MTDLYTLFSADFIQHELAPHIFAYNSNYLAQLQDKNNRNLDLTLLAESFIQLNNLHKSLRLSDKQNIEVKELASKLVTTYVIVHQDDGLLEVNSQETHRELVDHIARIFDGINRLRL